MLKSIGELKILNRFDLSLAKLFMLLLRLLLLLRLMLLKLLLLMLLLLMLLLLLLLKTMLPLKEGLNEEALTTLVVGCCCRTSDPDLETMFLWPLKIGMLGGSSICCRCCCCC